MSTTDQIIVAMLFVSFISFIAGVSIAVNKERGDFTQTECAQYNPVTSDFEFIEKPKLKAIV